MKRYTKKDAAGRNYIESVNGALESDVYGRVYGKAINRFAEFEDSDLVPKIDVEKLQKAYLQYEETTGIKKAKADAAKEIFDELEREIEDALKNNYDALRRFEDSDDLWHNVNGKINTLRGLEHFIGELKKKFEGKYGGSQ